jgi:diadenylate cyclase
LRTLVQTVVVGAGVYLILLRVARPRAFRILGGMIVMLAMYTIATFAHLDIIRWVLEAVFSYGAIAVLIIFQPELRAGLARLARSRLVRGLEDLEENELVAEVVDAVERLARSNVGAIIVIERTVSLEEYAETGTPLEARVGADLLVSIFSPYGPLHDGAVLIAGDTVFAAGVILPLTQFPVDDRSLGTRHRAAIGISEETDALAVVVSEETAQISIAFRGEIERDVEISRLLDAVTSAVAAREE